MTDIVSLPDAQPTLRVVPMPSDANYVGDIFGGWIMSQVDIAGSIPALRRAGGRVATAAVTSLVFQKPAGLAGALWGRGGRAGAAGLAMGTQRGSGTANAFAGGAGAAEDASTVWYTPAGMTALPAGTNAAIAGHLINPSFKFSNNGSTG